MSRLQCIGIIVLSFVIASHIWMLFDRSEPVTLHFTKNGEMIPYYVRSGQRVTILRPVIEHRACPGEYARRIKELRSGRIIFFEQLPVMPTTFTAYNDWQDRNKLQWFSRTLELPKLLAAGPAVYWTDGIRWCNYMQKLFWPIAFRSPDIPFEVLPDEPAERGEQGIQGERGERGPAGTTEPF